jgi:hypothetical protein
LSIENWLLVIEEAGASGVWLRSQITKHKCSILNEPMEWDAANLRVTNCPEANPSFPTSARAGAVFP